METPSILPNDPRLSYLTHRFEIDSAVASCFSSGNYILGEEVRLFENEFAAYLGVNHVIGVANGTDALELSLRACDIGPGCTVMTAANTASATLQAILATGATPYLLDVDSKTFTICISRLEKILQSSPLNKFHAIVPVHLYGLPVDLDSLSALARQYNIKIIEDCAQAHGASWSGKKVGSWGNTAAFSFYPTKNLGGLGDGGAIALNDDALADKIRKLRQYGWETRHNSLSFGRNSRLDEIQAAILRVKLRHLDGENEKRADNAAFYNSEFKSLTIPTPFVPSQARHVYHQYTLCVPDKSALEKNLSNERIGFGNLYSIPIHHQPAFEKVERDPSGLKNTEQVALRLINLPIHPYLQIADLKKIANVVKQTLC